jgi:hypothetical protein
VWRPMRASQMKRTFHQHLVVLFESTAGWTVSREPDPAFLRPGGLSPREEAPSDRSTDLSGTAIQRICRTAVGHGARRSQPMPGVPSPARSVAKVQPRACRDAVAEHSQVASFVSPQWWRSPEGDDPGAGSSVTVPSARRAQDL